MRSNRGLTLAGGGAAPLAALAEGRRRQSSPQALQWMSRLRYGAGVCPEFGSWGDHYSDAGMLTRQLYCQALVYASGGTRLARDWIAGSAALTTPSQHLLHTALQHPASESDLRRFRAHILELLTAPAEPAEGEALPPPPPSASGALGGGGVVARATFDALGGVRTTTLAPAPAGLGAGAGAAAASPADHGADMDGGGGAESTEAEDRATLAAAEMQLLSLAPECRCFLYDAMCAGHFHVFPLAQPDGDDGGSGDGGGGGGRSHFGFGDGSSSGGAHFTSGSSGGGEGDGLCVREGCGVAGRDGDNASCRYCASSRVLAAHRRRTFAIGRDYFGIPESVMEGMWRVVEAESELKREKSRTFFQPWGVE